MVAGKYLGRLANFLLVTMVYQTTLAALVLHDTGEFRPQLLILGLFLFAFVSAGGLIPPLIFALVAVVSHAFRK